jgi:hypothetical protein
VKSIVAFQKRWSLDYAGLGIVELMLHDLSVRARSFFGIVPFPSYCLRNIVSNVVVIASLPLVDVGIRLPLESVLL